MTKPFHIPSLDGLRAVAILIVFLSHAGLSHIVPGLFGVTIFFFLSGYLITTLMRMEYERTGSVHLRDFYMRRALRIFPPFYLVLGVIALLGVTGIVEGGFSWAAMAAQAGFISNYWEIYGGLQPAGTEVMWSLAVEEHFYLFFPLFYLALRRVLPERRHQFAVLMTLCGLVLAWRMLLVHGWQVIDLHNGSAHHPRTCHGTDTRLDGLLFGCALAVYGNPALDASGGRRWMMLWVALPLSVLVLLASFVLRDVAFRETWRYTIQGLALIPIFIAVIRYADWMPFRFLNWAWVRKMGVLSYAFYLVHSLVIALVKTHLPLSKLWQGVAAFLLSMALAWLMNEGIEKPCARLKKKFAAK
ncbi:MAG: acyltransferase [Verrucomicrobiaceae bacterium]|nr:acyltransferase [Verrucomicrobiaceae bacterium]